MNFEKIKSIVGDLFYSIAALVLLNGTIQLLVYPFLTRKMGATNFGVVLTLLSVVSIMASSFGTGANYSRMVVSTRQRQVKGDYNIFLAGVSLLSIIVSVIAMVVVRDTSIAAIIGLIILMIVSILRYYGDVNFRLELNYRGFFFYYLAIALGYGLGVALYSIFGSWAFTIIIGEAFATVYVIIKGNIYRKPLFQKSEQFNDNIKSMLVLSGAYIVSNIVLNADRILLMVFVGSLEVTVFYTATLIGKIIALLTGPLNGVIIGYLAKYRGPITKKMMLLFSMALLGIGVVVTACAVVASHIFVAIMYPDIYDQAKPLFLLASTGQILFFIAESYLVVVLRFTKEKLQFIINISYAILFFAVAIPFVITNGVMGMAYAIVIVNAIRFIAVSIIGIKEATGKPLVMG